MNQLAIGQTIAFKESNRNFAIVQDQQTIAYFLAFDLMKSIDQHLARQTRHYRTRDGQLLEYLDQVVRAILANELAGQEIAPDQVVQN